MPQIRQCDVARTEPLDIDISLGESNPTGGYGEAVKAIDDLKQWESKSPAEWSLMETSANVQKWSTVSKVYQFFGLLGTATSYLEGVILSFLKSQAVELIPIDSRLSAD